MAWSTNAEPAARQTWVRSIDRSIGGFRVFKIDQESQSRTFHETEQPRQPRRFPPACCQVVSGIRLARR
jgi:hypothetical protein